MFTSCVFREDLGKEVTQHSMAIFATFDIAFKIVVKPWLGQCEE